MIHQKKTFLSWVCLDPPLSNSSPPEPVPRTQTSRVKPTGSRLKGANKLAKTWLIPRGDAELGKENTERKEDSSPTDEAWLVAFEDYVENNLKDVSLSVPQLADEFAMSESTLLRQVKRLTGLSPAKYLQEMRLKQAYHLLETYPYLSVREVAAEVGYAHPGSFSRRFKDHFGKSPSDLQQV